MKTVLVITVIACLFVVGLAQNQNCVTQVSNLSGCISMAASGGGSTFCSQCASQLISYYSQCTNGVGVDIVQRHKFSSYLAN